MKKILFLISLLLIQFSSHAQYAILPLISGLDHPIAFDQSGDGRIFITLQKGIIESYDTSGAFLGQLYDISDSTFDYGECGMLGICVDPQFNVNHYVYVYYNHFDSNAVSTQAHMRVLRLTESNNMASAPLLLLDIPQLGNNHLGGNIHFSHSSLTDLYVTIGENTIQPNAQLISNPYGKILRIHSDGSIPSDNPFYDDGNPFTGNDDRIWVYGLRNSFDFTFSPLSDSLYATENGPTQDDEVNLIHPGKNYGWPTYTGYSNNPAFQDPMITWTPTIAPTGIVFYHDTTFPQFNNHLLMCMYNNGYVYDLTLGHPPIFDTITSSSLIFNFGAGFANFLTSIQQGPEGCIEILHGGPAGILYRIRPGTAGVEQQQDVTVQIYPIPANRFIQITASGNAGPSVTYTLYDVFGNKIMEGTCATSQAGMIHHTLDMEAVASGIYWLQIKSTGNSRLSNCIKKVVVNH